MAILQSDYAKGLIVGAMPWQAGSSVSFRFAMAVPTTVATGDILELAPRPPGCRIIDMVLDSDDLDAHETAAISLDIGIMSGAWQDRSQDRTVGAEFFSGATIARTGGVLRPTLITAFRSGISPVATSIGVKIATQAATAQAGSIGLTVVYTA